MNLNLKRIKNGIVGLMFFSATTTNASTPQEDVLSVMIYLQTNSNPISLAKYERMSRSELIETRLFLEQGMATNTDLTIENKTKLLRQFDREVAGKVMGPNGQDLGADFLAPSGLSAVSTLPFNEKQYLKALSVGDGDGALAFRQAIVKAKSLGFAQSGIGAGTSLKMAHAYLAISTDSIAIASGIDSGDISDAVSTSLKLTGTPPGSVNLITNSLLDLSTNPLERVDAMSVLEGHDITGGYTTNLELKLDNKVNISFGQDDGLIRSSIGSGASAAGAASGIGSGL